MINILKIVFYGGNMYDTVRNFAIDYQDWASTQNLSYEEVSQWAIALEHLAELADPSGELLEELKENGVI